MPIALRTTFLVGFLASTALSGCTTATSAQAQQPGSESAAPAIAATPPGTAIASGHALATEAGLEMIRAGIRCAGCASARRGHRQRA